MSIIKAFNQKILNHFFPGIIVQLKYTTNTWHKKSPEEKREKLKHPNPVSATLMPQSIQIHLKLKKLCYVIGLIYRICPINFNFWRTKFALLGIKLNLTEFVVLGFKINRKNKREREISFK